MKTKQMKYLLTAVLALSLALIFVACTRPSTPTAAADTSVSSDAGATFTLEELATYDGQNGNPAYIAIDGTVYDVTDVPQWINGMHNGYTAGKDLTEQMQAAPHGFSKLSGLTAVGTLIK